jgi:hypothetical protein
MSALRTALLALPLVVVPAAPGADEKPAPSASVNITGSYQRAAGPEGTHGHCNGIVVFEKDLPLIGFGLNKRPKEKGRYTYVLLFKNRPGKLTRTGVAGRMSSTGSSVDESMRLMLGDKDVEVVYQFSADEKTHALKSETVKVGGTEVKPDGPRVFLVDLSREKVTYRPVKVALPDAVPDFDDGEKKTWPATAVRAVEELCKKSPEVKKFLGR